VDGEFHGKGQYIWANGDVYEGDFVNGKITGKGKKIWPNGEVYEGDWLNDNRTGKGKYTDANGIERNMNIAQWGSKIALIDDGMPVVDGKYTTYALGTGAIIDQPLGAKVPYEMVRDAKTNGGVDELLTRNRRIIAPRGISFTKASMAKKSPTDAELKNGANWTLVNDGDGNSIDDKAILICRIISVEETI
jgi:hypothetical protein